MFLSSAGSFKINFFKKFFQEYHQSVKQFGSRSWSKLFTKSYQQMTLGDKEKAYPSDCKFGNFRKNYIFPKSVKSHICDVKNSQLGHDLPI